MPRRIPSAVALAVLLVAAAAAIAGSLFVGPTPWEQVTDTIAMKIRLPRACLAFVTGAALGAAGVVFQGLFRNPLADPFVTGVSGGAALGAVVAIVTGLSGTILGLTPVTLCAFAGSLGAVFIVHRLARVRGRVPVTTLLLAGFALGSLSGALVSVLLLYHTRNWNEILQWLMGTLSDARWIKVQIAVPFIAISIAVMARHARALNVMLLGDEPAQQLGVDVERTKLILMIAGSVATAAAVSMVGIVGFVGLIIPHIVRQLVGPDHRALLPATVLAGGTFLVAADIVSRALFPPAGLPIGAVTALCGAPFFLWLLRQRGLRV